MSDARERELGRRYAADPSKESLQALQAVRCRRGEHAIGHTAFISPWEKNPVRSCAGCLREFPLQWVNRRTRSIAIGHNAVATSANSIAIGNNAVAIRGVGF